ncbi:uncharacterized protein METZ01_LOCUS417392, partial [marine metagenome]
MLTLGADDVSKNLEDENSTLTTTHPVGTLNPHSARTQQMRIAKLLGVATNTRGNYMAIEMTDEMVEHVDNNQANRKPCILATAGKDGWPSMGFRASMMVFDKDHLAFWERSNKDGLSNMQENPQVLVMYRDPEARVAFKFYGHVTIHDSGEMRESVWERTVQPEKDADP